MSTATALRRIGNVFVLWGASLITVGVQVWSRWVCKSDHGGCASRSLSITDDKSRSTSDLSTFST